MADDPDIQKPTGPPQQTHHKDFLSGFPTLADFSNEGLKRVAEASKAFQSLPPAGPLWDLQKSYPEFRRAMKNCRTRIEPLIKLLLEHEKVSTMNYGKRALEEKLEFVIEANDDILERVGTALDDADGLFKRTEIVVVNKSMAGTSIKSPMTWAGKKKFASATTGGDFRDTSAEFTKKQPIIALNKDRPVKKALHKIRVIEKPQLKFADLINNSLGAFIPKLKMKYNSIKPLSVLPEYTSSQDEFFGHPYDMELTKWTPANFMMEVTDPISPKPFDKTPFTFITNPDQLEVLIAELRNVKEIAVDLEHHSYRTFLGLTCLIQISTREKDYIIDTLALWRHLEILNEIFTNPKIVKILHGSQSDLEWLQRDFGVYIVGLFDTFLAMKQLDFDQFSLQHLLSRFCSVTVDKTHQLADWRLRPLPEDMVTYARQDTHYLCYIYDRLKAQLVEKGNEYKNLLRAVYDQSRHLCLRRYEKPSRNAQLALRQTRRGLNNRQTNAFTDIYNWRDTIAREKDESLGFVLPNHMLLTIAETLPKEMSGILACCEPVPPLLHQNLGDIHRIVLKARDLPLHEDQVEQIVSSGDIKKQNSWMNHLYSVFDFGIITDLSVKKTDSSSVWKAETVASGETWARPYTPPTGWEKVLKESPSFPLGRSRESSINGVKKLKKSSAFERYRLSNKILHILRNPEKKGNLDVDDELVRLVRDTIFTEKEEDKPLCDLSESQDATRKSGVDKLLPEKEFVPINPLGYGKRRGRKRSPSVLIAADSKKSKQTATEVIDLDSGSDTPTANIKEEENEEVEPTINVPLPRNLQAKQKRNSRRRNKKNKNFDSNPQSAGNANNARENVTVVKDDSIQDLKRGRDFFKNHRSNHREGKSITFRK